MMPLILVGIGMVCHQHGSRHTAVGSQGHELEQPNVQHVQ